jgi:hypothetical protein
MPCSTRPTSDPCGSEEFTNGQWYSTNYNGDERMYMQPEGSATAAASPDLAALFQGYQYFYDQYFYDQYTET